MKATETPKIPHRASAPQPSQVKLRWLLGALGLLVLAAVCCAYLSLCLLFLQGQWQLLYQPRRASADAHADSATPADIKLPFSAVRFGPNEAALSELSGWWVPAASSIRPGPTVLYLHDGSESLGDKNSSALADIARLHALGCAVLAFDYRGFGASAAGRPSEARMVEDARRALLYLTETRHLPAASIVLWGRGIGATIAAEAADQQSPQLRLVLEAVNPPALVLLGADPRTRLLPLRLLLRDRLDAAPALSREVQKKLFLEAAPEPSLKLSQRTSPDATSQLYSVAAGPKLLSTTADVAAVRLFLSPEGSRVAKQ